MHGSIPKEPFVSEVKSESKKKKIRDDARRRDQYSVKRKTAQSIENANS